MAGAGARGAARSGGGRARARSARVAAARARRPARPAAPPRHYRAARLLRPPGTALDLTAFVYLVLSNILSVKECPANCLKCLYFRFESFLLLSFVSLIVSNVFRFPI